MNCLNYLKLGRMKAKEGRVELRNIGKPGEWEGVRYYLLFHFNEIDFFDSFPIAHNRPPPIHD
jgi:hypothetical protein